MINLESLREQVYEFLRQELHIGNLVPGSPINLDEISRRLGISKVPLRGMPSSSLKSMVSSLLRLRVAST
jgi:DNA-binding GntR family transcriptional regulator